METQRGRKRTKENRTMKTKERENFQKEVID